MASILENNKITAIWCLFFLALADIVISYLNNTNPVHAGTAIGAIAGFITSDKIHVESKNQLQ